MTPPDSVVLFLYHLFWGVTISVVVSLWRASSVATQATLVKDYTGNFRTTFKVDRREFLRTWGLYAAAGTATTFLVLLLWQLRTFMRNAGFIG